MYVCGCAASGVRAQGQGTPAYFLCHIKQEGVGGAVGKAVTVDKEEKRVGIKVRPTTSAPCSS